MKAKLYLEDGSIFEGTLHTTSDFEIGEVVFNTSMSGYQEIATDPSYKGQILIYTYPLIGNVGTNMVENESKKPQVSGVIVKEMSSDASHYEMIRSFASFLDEQGIPALSIKDTRALTKLIRTKGVMKGIISKKELSELEQKKYFNQVDLSNVVYESTVKEAFTKGDGDYHVALIDFGVKDSILDQLLSKGLKVTVVPALTVLSDLAALQVDGIFLSNGPGDPRDLTEVIKELKEWIGTYPIAGICLGHQLLGLATGAEIRKMSFGHRGANHPVKDMRSGKIYITSQNHGYVIEEGTLDQGFDVTHMSMNDHSIEGMMHLEKQIYSVQFHPEAGPGPKDAYVIFDEFVSFLKGGNL